MNINKLFLSLVLMTFFSGTLLSAEQRVTKLPGIKLCLEAFGTNYAKRTGLDGMALIRIVTAGVCALPSDIATKQIVSYVEKHFPKATFATKASIILIKTAIGYKLLNPFIILPLPERVKQIEQKITEYQNYFESMEEFLQEFHDQINITSAEQISIDALIAAYTGLAQQNLPLFLSNADNVENISEIIELCKNYRDHELLELIRLNSRLGSYSMTAIGRMEDESREYWLKDYHTKLEHDIACINILYKAAKIFIDTDQSQCIAAQQRHQQRHQILPAMPAEPAEPAEFALINMLENEMDEAIDGDIQDQQQCCIS